MFVILLLMQFTTKAQDRSARLHKLVESAEELRFPSMSGNGEWIAWQSVYESKPSELKITAVKDLKKTIIEAGAQQWQFIRENEILYRIGNIAKYRNLAENKEHSFTNVKLVGYLEHLGLIYIHHQDKESNRLDFYDKHLKMVQSFSEVKRIFNVESEMMMVKENASSYELIKYNGKKWLPIYTSPSDIYSVKPSGMKTGGWLLILPSGKGSKMTFIDDKFSSVELSVDGVTKFDGILQNPSSDGDAILVNLETNKTSKKEFVDIWYGKDFDLENHFKAEKNSRKVLWYPKENRVVETSHKDYSPIAAIGKSGIFLRSEIDHQQVDKNDKTAIESVESYFLYDPKTKENTAFASTSQFFIMDSLAKFLLYKDLDKWVSYNVSERSQGKKLAIPLDAIPHYTSSEEVLWVIGHQLWKQNLKTSQKKMIATFPGNEIEILNVKKNKYLMEYKIISQFVNLNENIILKLKRTGGNTTSIVVWNSKTTYEVVEKTKDRIFDFIANKNSTSFVWLAENYNKSPEIHTASFSKKSKLIYSSAKEETSTNQISMRKLNYKGINGEELSAILYFPPGYSEVKIYPVAVSIYELQQQYANKFLKPTFKNSRGFNERIFLELGYMVMLPDINQIGWQGPGVIALHNINAALDELEKVTQADMKKVGLVGQSFGGYETNFIATHSDRFAAYISGASISDIINTSFAFNYNFFSADYYRYEDGQFKLGKFIDDKGKYYRNNPLYYADRVHSPVLLWTGTADKNVNPEQTRSFYNALRKYKKPVVALFYQDEQHSLMGSKQRKDLTTRMVEWLDYFLKDKKGIPWIDKQMQASNKQP